MLEERRVLHARHHLTEEGDRLLAQLLGIPCIHTPRAVNIGTWPRWCQGEVASVPCTDVAVDDLLERQLVPLVGVGKHALVLVCLDHEFSSHRVRRPHHRLQREQLSASPIPFLPPPHVEGACDLIHVGLREVTAHKGTRG